MVSDTKRDQLWQATHGQSFIPVPSYIPLWMQYPICKQDGANEHR